MTSEQTVLLGLLISTIVTIVGWAVTVATQMRILRETQKSNQLERELAVFRERLATVRGITSTLLELSTSYHELIAMFASSHFDFEAGARLMTTLNAKSLKLAKILYDPGFCSIRDLLPAEQAEQIYEQFENASDLAAEFHAKATAINPLNRALDTALRESASRALGVSRLFIQTANMFADTFAVLDRKLATGDTRPLPLMTRFLRRLGFKRA